MVLATLLTVAERKWSAFTQDRIGPERARIGIPWVRDHSLGGLPHVAADALKMIFKEDTRPKAADKDKVLFWLGPVLAFAPVFALAAVIPFGPTVAVNEFHVAAQVANPNFGLLWVFAIASLAVYGTSLAGWASNSKFALLGGVRAASQMISYEVALGLSLVGMMVAFTTVQLPVMIGSASAGTGQANTSGAAVSSAWTSGFRRGAFSFSPWASFSSLPRPLPRPSARPSTFPKARARSLATSSSTRA